MATPFGAVMGFAASVLVCPTFAEGGQVVVTWQQPADCAEVDAWELLAAPLPVPAATPAPGGAPVVATIPKQPVHCTGASATATVNVSALGATRFWMRAVRSTPPAVTSGVSNSADASVPLGKPSSLTVVAP